MRWPGRPTLSSSPWTLTARLQRQPAERLDPEQVGETDQRTAERKPPDQAMREVLAQHRPGSIRRIVPSLTWCPQAEKVRSGCASHPGACFSPVICTASVRTAAGTGDLAWSHSG